MSKGLWFNHHKGQGTERSHTQKAETILPIISLQKSMQEDWLHKHAHTHFYLFLYLFYSYNYNGNNMCKNKAYRNR
jgi:hypothetical protein